MFAENRKINKNTERKFFPSKKNKEEITVESLLKQKQGLLPMYCPVLFYLHHRR